MNSADVARWMPLLRDVYGEADPLAVGSKALAILPHLREVSSFRGDIVEQLVNKGRLLEILAKCIEAVMKTGLSQGALPLLEIACALLGDCAHHVPTKRNEIMGKFLRSLVRALKGVGPQAPAKLLATLLRTLWCVTNDVEIAQASVAKTDEVVRAIAQLVQHSNSTVSRNAASLVWGLCPLAAPAFYKYDLVPTLVASLKQLIGQTNADAPNKVCEIIYVYLGALSGLLSHKASAVVLGRVRGVPVVFDCLQFKHHHVLAMACHVLSLASGHSTENRDAVMQCPNCVPQLIKFLGAPYTSEGSVVLSATRLVIRLCVQNPNAQLQFHTEAVPKLTSLLVTARKVPPTVVVLSTAIATICTGCRPARETFVAAARAKVDKNKVSMPMAALFSSLRNLFAQARNGSAPAIRQLGFLLSNIVALTHESTELCDMSRKLEAPVILLELLKITPPIDKNRFLVINVCGALAAVLKDSPATQTTLGEQVIAIVAKKLDVCNSSYITLCLARVLFQFSDDDALMAKIAAIPSTAKIFQKAAAIGQPKAAQAAAAAARAGQ